MRTFRDHRPLSFQLPGERLRSYLPLKNGALPATRPAVTTVSPPFGSVEEAELRARHRIPKSVYTAFSGGDRFTVADNRQAFRELGFRPHVATRHEQRELSTTVLGRPLAFPVIVSPVGGLRLAHRDGEIGAATAAGAVGTAVGVSTMSSHPLAEITAATPGPVWYQVYLAGGKAAVEGAIERARAAGCAALVVTVDLLGVSGQPVSNSARDQIPTRITVRNAVRYGPEMALRPRWFWDYAREGLRLEAVNVRPVPDGPPMLFAEALPVTPTWDDVRWIGQLWGGPLVVKGVLRPDDARQAVDAGADAVVVSNHGGFVLDGVAGSLRALQGVVEAVGSETEVLLDGGVRSGADVVKALALGARAVLCGRASVWGLAAGGSAGLQRVLELLRDGVDRTLAELGCPSVHDLDPSWLDLPASWPARR